MNRFENLDAPKWSTISIGLVFGNEKCKGLAYFSTINRGFVDVIVDIFDPSSLEQ